jgi:hypothetical protein
MRSCTVVVVNEALEKHDVTFATKPRVLLKAVPYGSFKKQLMRKEGAVDQEVFVVYESATNLPAEITGMAVFFTVKNSDGVILEVKGRIDLDTKGLVSFNLQPLDKGFYSYSVDVRASNYSQIILDGTYVVQA